MRPGDQYLRNEWPAAWCRGALLGGMILSLFYRWFAIENRYIIFLYTHLGATPFDRETGSRYWMAGLVAVGLVGVFYAPADLIWQRLAMRLRWADHPPARWRVWLCATIVLSIGIPLITMTCNWPTLSGGHALACTAATLAGLAVLLPLMGRSPGELIWLGADGLGLMPVLLGLRLIEWPERGPALPVDDVLVRILALCTPVLSLVWLGGMTWLYRRQRLATPSAGLLLAAGCTMSYVLLPLAHYVWAAPNYRYITSASNFFARTLLTQGIVLGAAAILSWGVWRIRRAMELE